MRGTGVPLTKAQTERGAARPRCRGERPVEHDGGDRFAYFFDPAGNRVSSDFFRDGEGARMASWPWPRMAMARNRVTSTPRRGRSSRSSATRTATRSGSSGRPGSASTTRTSPPSARGSTTGRVLAGRPQRPHRGDGDRSAAADRAEGEGEAAGDGDDRDRPAGGAAARRWRWRRCQATGSPRCSPATGCRHRPADPQRGGADAAAAAGRGNPRRRPDRRALAAGPAGPDHRRQRWHRPRRRRGTRARGGRGRAPRPQRVGPGCREAEDSRVRSRGGHHRRRRERPCGARRRDR